MSVQMGQWELELGPPRQRALLALLLINAGKVVSVPGIISAIWGSSPPSSVVGTLQSYVSRLRKAIAKRPPAGQPASLLALHYQAPGYVLDVDRDLIDAVRFQAAVESGRELFSHGDPAAACETAGKALSLWRGTPYGELASYDFALLENTRLEQLRLLGLQTWADACLELARYDEVVRKLDDEVRKNPMLERLGSRLMLAQYHSGQPAEALLTFERIRTHVAQELGADSSRELQKLHASILRQDLVPVGQVTNGGVPRERASAGQASAVRQPEPGPVPVPAATPEPDREPAPTPAEARVLDGELVGCERELERLRALAVRGHAGRTVLVVGEQGVGKTHLLQALEGKLRAASMPSLRAHCADVSDTPESEYWIWTQIVQKIRLCRPEKLRSLPVSVLEALDLTAPDTAQTSSGHGQQLTPTQHFAFQEAVCQALAAAGSEPLVLFLEDLHLADARTLSLLHLLTKEIRETRIVVVGTFRDHHVASRPEIRRVLANLLQEDASEITHLSALSIAETRTLIGRVSESPPSWGLVSNLHRATGGNPYLLRKMLDATDVAEEPYGPSSSLSFDLGFVLRSRLAECPAPVTRILQICAVIGGSVDRRLLTEVLAGLGESSASVGDAQRTGLLSMSPDNPHVYLFTQGLVRDTLLADLDLADLANLHHAVAKVLAEGMVHARYGANARRIVSHCAEAAKGIDLFDAVGPLVRLGDHAERLLLHHEAQAWLLHAVAILHDQSQEYVRAKADLELELELQMRVVWLLWLTQGGGSADSVAAYAQAEVLQRRLGNTTPAPLTAVKAVVHLSGGNYSQGWKSVQQLSELAEHGGGAEASVALSYGRGALLFTSNQLPDAVGELEKGLSLVDGLPEGTKLNWFMGQSHRNPRINFRATLAICHWLLGHEALAQQYRDEMLQLTQSDLCERPWDRAFARYADGILAVLEGDTERVWQASTSGLHLSMRCQLDYVQHLFKMLLGWAEVRLGQRRGGLLRMRRALNAASRPGLFFGRVAHLGFLADAERTSGLLDSARWTARSMAGEIAERGEYVYLRRRWPFAVLLTG